MSVYATLRVPCPTCSAPERDRRGAPLPQRAPGSGEDPSCPGHPCPTCRGERYVSRRAPARER